MKNKIICAVIIIAIIAIVVALAINTKNSKSGGANAGTTENTTAEITEITSIDLSNMVEFEDRVKQSDLEVNEEVLSVVYSINDAMYKYYQSNYKNKNLLSIYGYLYDDNKSNIITAEQLRDEGLFECTDEYINMDVLLLKPSSLVRFDSLDIDASTDELEIFTALKLKEGYLISSKDSDGGVISDEQYRELVLSYMFDHGEVRILNANDDSYEEIVSKVVEKSEFVNYDIKYIACDEVYAVVVIGDLNNVADNKEYVLINHGSWDIEIDGLETQNNVRWAVNSKLPNMELGLLPKYALRSYGQVKTGFEPYVNSLIELGMVNKNELPTAYSCGVDRFVYLEFTSGKKMIGCVDENGKLEFYEVKNSTEAIKYMLEYDDNPPVFIIKYGQQ